MGDVMIIAFHNPPEFNGIECIPADETECPPEKEKAIEDACECGVRRRSGIPSGA